MNTSLWQDLFSHMALKGTVLLSVALLLGLLLHRLSAARRYALWLGVAATLTALPLAVPFLPAWRVLPAAAASLPFPFPEEERTAPPPSQSPVVVAALPEKPAPVPAQIPLAPVVQPDVRHPPSPASYSWPEFLGLLPMICLGISLLLLARIGLSAWRLRILEKRCSPLPAELFGPLATEIGLRRLPRFLQGPCDAVPMVWGIVRPRLLLPAGFQSWPPNQLRSVLLHELAHLKRRDPAGLALAQLMHALHAWNPLAWLLFRRLRADQERACDDTVLRHGIRPSDYAQHLLNLSRSTRLAPGLSLCALAMANPAPIESRVTTILDPRRSRAPATRRWSFTLLTLTGLIAVPLAMLQALEGPKPRGRILDRNGVVLAETTPTIARRYPLKALTTHVVGYVNQPVALRDTAHPIAGVAALEKQANTQLNSGEDVTLTLDARIQQIAHRAVGEAGFTRASVVVIDPRDGDVLAMVSLPTYDPNYFIPTLSIDTWNEILANVDHPLLDRTISSSFPPGAAFLPVTALAAISAGKADTSFECTGSVTYGNKRMSCWIGTKKGAHGILNMRQALVQTCHCYWYQMANEVGFEAIIQSGRRLGFGATTGTLPGQSAGILPDREWLARHWTTQKWGEAHTANLAIGQGTVLVSPLQMAVAAATLANGGKVPQPTLLQNNDPPTWKADLVKEGLPPAQIETLRRALWEKVNLNPGTGKEARSVHHAIAGATGTTQSWRRVGEQKISENNGWFIGFAPYDKPTLAFAVFIQGAKSGGSSCGPIAKRLVEEALALPADGSGKVDPVEASNIQSSDERAQAVRVWLKKSQGVPPLETPLDNRFKGPEKDRPILEPSDEKRWRWLQRLGDLQELPRGAHNIRSGLVGDSFPRTSTLVFEAPRNSVRAWLDGSPGYWRYNRGLQRILSRRPKGSTLGDSISPDLVAMSGATADWLNGPAGRTESPKWPAIGRITALCSASGLTHCTVTIDLTASADVQVTVKATTNPSRIHIAD